MELKTYLENDIETIIIKAKKYQIQLINIGASIYKLLTPNKNKKYENIVLSLPSIQEYKDNTSGYVGCTIGRNAGRISNGTFKIDKKIFYVPKNSQKNNLHSSGTGCHNKPFKSKIKRFKNKIFVSYKYNLKSQEDKFPGNIKIEVIYSCYKKHFFITYKAIADKDTICNITNHSYFNLSGNNKTNILNHLIKNSFQSIYKLNNQNIPIKKINSKEIFGKSKFLKIENIIKNNVDFFKKEQGIDNPFILKNNTILIKNKKSGRKLRIKTSYPSIVLYTQNYKIKLIKGCNNAIAIEPQFIPNDININNCTNSLLRKNKKYLQFIKFYFK